MNKRYNMLLAVANMLSIADERNPFEYPTDIKYRFNPEYKVKLPKRQLKKFTVNGKEVDAYSRKDAIKRLKALNFI